MEIVYAVPILAMLVFALVTANRVAKRNRLRRRMLQSAIGGDKRALRFKDKESSRSEMRAFDDPSTVMGEIKTTTSAPDFGQKRRSKKRRK